MPKNKGKGGKNRKKGKGAIPVNKELLRKESGQEYGQVIKLCGDCRLEVLCFDGMQRLGHIRGKLQRRVWIGKDDLVLVSLRDFQDRKCDIIYRYSHQEAQKLKDIGELPTKFNLETVRDKDPDNDDDADIINVDDQYFDQSFGDSSNEEESDIDDDLYYL